MSIKRLSGAHVPHYKNTASCAPARMPAPAKVTIPMGMHIGAPCTPVVKVGDLVKVGQVIGEASGFVSVPVHASVSGKVTALTEIQVSNGSFSKAVVIESDGEQAVSETVVPPVVETYEQFTAALRASGLVGLGGAGFPTAVKFSVKDPSQVEYLLINGAECEPYITSDTRTMVDDADHIIKGAMLIRKFLGVKNIAIVIEDNKPEAISIFREKTAQIEGFTVEAMPAIYPQGGEKVLIHNVTGRDVPEGKLPLDVGCIVINCTSLAFISKYIETGMPLVEKCITVDGSAVANPQNVIAPIGTALSDIFEFCGGYKAEPKKILLGGPMMGIAVPDDSVPLLKNNNAILAFAEKEASLPETTACIKCGRCAAACPAGLMPMQIERAYKLKNVEELNRLKVMLCMECGCCSFVCPAKRELVLVNKLAKGMVRAAMPPKK
ncbi:MAG: electron transport complex subunit RsxC [Oscillospiraceae bacterium]|nr:MAG: electron transport complex subunit RsxC [Oscillospiraceae bacterium]